MCVCVEIHIRQYTHADHLSPFLEVIKGQQLFLVSRDVLMKKSTLVSFKGVIEPRCLLVGVLCTVH